MVLYIYNTLYDKSTSDVLSRQWTCSHAILFPSSIPAPDGFMVYSRNTEIHIVSLGISEVSDVVLPLANLTGAVAIDLDPVTETIYWTDIFQNKISTAKTDVR